MVALRLFVARGAISWSFDEGLGFAKVEVFLSLEFFDGVMLSVETIPDREALHKGEVVLRGSLPTQLVVGRRIDETIGKSYRVVVDGASSLIHFLDFQPPSIMLGPSFLHKVISVLRAPRALSVVR